jgi:hypothetical protein
MAQRLVNGLNPRENEILQSGAFPQPLVPIRQILPALSAGLVDRPNHRRAEARPEKGINAKAQGREGA